jgi:hypothetical protein
LDFDLQTCTRHCASSGRELLPGEAFYTVLRQVGREVERADYATDVWTTPPADCLAWWKSQLPLPDQKKPTWAPNDVMLQLFESLAHDPAQADLRYVLSLLLVQRRILKVEASTRDAQGVEQLTLYCPRQETTYQLPAIVPAAERIQSIQQQIGQLLS